MKYFLFILILIGCENIHRNEFKLVKCGPFSDCDIAGYFLDKIGCEEMKDKMNRPDNVYRYICEQIK